MIGAKAGHCLNGSAASHVAALARARNVPMITGTGPFELGAEPILLVDGGTGSVIIDPQSADIPANISHLPRAEPPADPGQFLDNGCVETADGVSVEVSVNISALSELDHIDPATTAGVGLLRTEFLLSSPSDIFNEDEQFAAYCRIMEWADGRAVTIRLFDLGGDKAFPTIAGEHGSFLGLRGIRLLLSKPGSLRVQARALLRAAPFGQLRIMLPMVTIPAEVEETARIIQRRPTSWPPASSPGAAVGNDGRSASCRADARDLQAGRILFLRYQRPRAISRRSSTRQSCRGWSACGGPYDISVDCRQLDKHRFEAQPVGICGDMASVRSLQACLTAGCAIFRHAVALDVVKSA